MNEEEYIVIARKSLDELEEKINMMIEDGWQLQGGIAVSVNNDTGKDYFLQAIINDQPKERNGINMNMEPLTHWFGVEIPAYEDMTNGELTVWILLAEQTLENNPIQVEPWTKDQVEPWTKDYLVRTEILLKSLRAEARYREERRNGQPGKR